MMRRFMGALVGLLSLCAAHTAQAAYTITFDGGGVIHEYYEKYTTLRQSGVEVIIDGPCLSACTVVFTQIEPDKVCVTPRAVFGFHSASDVTPISRTFSKDGTGLMWFAYPKAVRDWLTAQGWDGTTAHPELIWMDNETARTFFKACPTTPKETNAQ